MKKQLPLLLGFLAGAFALAEFYIPAQGMRPVQSFLLETAQILAAAALLLGGINVIQVNLPIIQRRRDDWQYKLVLIGSALGMLFCGIAWHTFGGRPTAGMLSIAPAAPPAAAGADAPPDAARPDTAFVTVRVSEDDADVAIDGVLEPVIGHTAARVVAPGKHKVRVSVARVGYTSYEAEFTVAAGETASVKPRLTMMWGPTGRTYTWFYDHVFAPCNATMFALLAFFIASAAFRAFRARNVDAALLLGAAILVMIGRVPIGRSISPWFPELAEWIIDVPNNAGRRAIMMGAALGAIATSLRVILGLERSHLGND